MDEEPGKRSEADAELEREIRKERKFTLAEAIGRMAGPGAMKGASPISRAQQSEIEIQDWLRLHLSAEGEQARRLHAKTVGLGYARVEMPLTPHQFQLQRAARRGEGNPKRMFMPLWEELVRSGETAHAAAMRYASSLDGPAGWCFDRFGMSRTRLPDGRIVCIAGEHEDYYDPDFFIYNDVIVIGPDGTIDIYGYSTDVFRPTDFHTATLVGDAIYIIGCVGYRAERGGSTSVYRLDLRTMKIRSVVTGGDEPGWISDHWAELESDKRSIRIAGGKVLTSDAKGKEVFHPNTSVFRFDAVAEVWSQAEGDVPTLMPLPGELPLGWTALKKHTNAKDIRDAIVRAVGPEHPLFCDDFWPIAQWESFPSQYMVQMLNSNRWAICAEFDFLGRQDPPPKVELYSTVEEVLAAARAISESEY